MLQRLAAFDNIVGLPASCWVGHEDTYLKPDSWMSLHLKGWQEDTIAMVGVVGPATEFNFHRILLPDWENANWWSMDTRYGCEVHCLQSNLSSRCLGTKSAPPPLGWPDWSEDGEPLASGYARVLSPRLECFRRSVHTYETDSPNVQARSEHGITTYPISPTSHFFHLRRKAALASVPQGCGNG